MRRPRQSVHQMTQEVLTTEGKSTAAFTQASAHLKSCEYCRSKLKQMVFDRRKNVFLPATSM